MDQGEDLLTAHDAAALLGVSLPTLYAYVSRGRIRSTPGEDGRARHYGRRDIEALLARREHRRPLPSHHGWETADLVLDSGLTLVEDGQLYYQGYNAGTLADHASFEQVAWLLWTGDLVLDVPDADRPVSWSARAQVLLGSLDALPPISRCQVLLPVLEAEDLAAHDLRPAKVRRTGLRILRGLTAAITLRPDTGRPLAEMIREAWAGTDDRAGRIVNAVLVLLAAHDLSTHALAARCAASAGSTPYGAIAAGLATLEGIRQGGQEECVDALFREAASEGDLEQIVASRLKRGAEIPGFGHIQYPTGDPRAAHLLATIQNTYDLHPQARLAAALADTVRRELDVAPNIDFALVAASRVLGLPRGAPLALLALARSAGWLGHALEQYSSGRQIRPRARYIGPRPDRPIIDTGHPTAPPLGMPVDNHQHPATERGIA